MTAYIIELYAFYFLRQAKFRTECIVGNMFIDGVLLCAVTNATGLWSANGIRVEQNRSDR